jgi:aspartyl-tRNA(Asn)/glutamyl-tRNA(Gln) amidotransferase subunit A
VAAGECLGALGTDTGGSIRHPASYCGIFGLKPTYGRVSRHGLIALASSLDTIGPMTRSVEDAALLLEVIAGADQQDATTVPKKVPDYTKSLVPDYDLRGLTIGIPKEFLAGDLDGQVKKAFDQAKDQVKKLGAKVKEVSLPHSQDALAVYYIIQPSEASANLARYDGIRYGYSAATDCKEKIATLEDVYYKTRGKALGPEVKRRIMLGTYALSKGYYDEYYLKAQKVRTVIISEIQDAFTGVDLLMTPTAPTPAFKLDEIQDPLTLYLMDIFVAPFNISGHPALSMPMGPVDGLPVGLQLVAPQFRELRILRAAYALERATDWAKAKPSI